MDPMCPIGGQGGLAHSAGAIENRDRAMAGGAIRQHTVQCGNLVLAASEVPHWCRQLPRHRIDPPSKGRSGGLPDTACLHHRPGHRPTVTDAALIAHTASLI